MNKVNVEEHIPILGYNVFEWVPNIDNIEKFVHDCRDKHAYIPTREKSGIGLVQLIEMVENFDVVYIDNAGVEIHTSTIYSELLKDIISNHKLWIGLIGDSQQYLDGHIQVVVSTDEDAALKLYDECYDDSTIILGRFFLIYENFKEGEEMK